MKGLRGGAVGRVAAGVTGLAVFAGAAGAGLIGVAPGGKLSSWACSLVPPPWALKKPMMVREASRFCEVLPPLMMGAVPPGQAWPPPLTSQSTTACASLGLWQVYWRMVVPSPAVSAISVMAGLGSAPSALTQASMVLATEMRGSCETSCLPMPPRKGMKGSSLPWMCNTGMPALTVSAGTSRTPLTTATALNSWGASTAMRQAIMPPLETPTRQTRSRSARPSDASLSISARRKDTSSTWCICAQPQQPPEFQVRASMVRPVPLGQAIMQPAASAISVRPVARARMEPLEPLACSAMISGWASPTPLRSEKQVRERLPTRRVLSDRSTACAGTALARVSTQRPASRRRCSREAARRRGRKRFVMAGVRAVRSWNIAAMLTRGDNERKADLHETASRPPGSAAGRNGQAAYHGRTRHEGFQRARHVGEVLEADQLARFVEADEVADPREGGDIGDGVGVAGQPCVLGQALVHHGQQTARFIDVAVTRALVFVFLAGEAVEEAQLAKHRTDAAHLEHHPLDHLVTLGGILGDELAGLLGQVQQDRARFEQRQRLAAGAIGIDDRGNLVVRIQRQERRRHLVVGLEADQVGFVGQAGFFQHDRDLHAIGRGQRVQLDAVGVLRRPFLVDGEAGQCMAHGGFLCGRKLGIEFLREFLESLDGDRTAEEVTLVGMASGIGQEAALGIGLHTFGDDTQAQALGEVDDGLGDRGIVGIDQDIAHERLVDFKLIQRQPLEVGQGGVTGAEIVQRELHAIGLEGEHLLDDVFDIVHQQALGEFQLEAARIGAGPFDGIEHGLDEIGLAQLRRADIDGNAQVFAVGLVGPGGQLLARGLQHPVAQREDQSGLFGQRDEVARWHHAALRVLPAHQHFGTSHAAAFDDLWLVVQQQLVAVDGFAQAGLQRGAFQHGGLHGRVEEAQRIAAGFLGFIHGQVGLFHQLIHRGRAAQEDGRTDTGGGAVLDFVELIGRAQRDQDLLSYGAGLGGGFLLVLVEALQHHHEFVATDAGHGIVLTHVGHQPLGHLLEQHIAFFMADGVVQGLEVIQVDEQQGRTSLGAQREGDGLLEAVQQQGAIGQAGQGVEEGQFADAFLGQLAVADVVMGADVVGDLVILVLDGRDGEPFGIDFAVLAAVPDLTLPLAEAPHALAHLLEEGRAVAVRTQQVGVLADDLFSRIAGDLAEGLVHAQDLAVGVSDEHALARVEGHCRDAQFGLDLLAVGNVPAAGAETREGAVRIGDGRRGQGQPEHRAILAHAAELDILALLSIHAPRQFGADAAFVVGMDDGADEVLHLQAFLDRVAGVVAHGMVDPARPAIQAPPDFPVDGAIGDGAELLFAGAQFGRHLLRQAHGAHATGHHQPGQQRQRHAHGHAGGRDEVLGIAAELGGEAIGGVHGQGPVVVGHHQVFIGRQLRRHDLGRFTGGVIHQHPRLGLDAIVEREGNAAGAFAIEAGDDIGHAKDRMHPADQAGTSLCNGALGLAALVERQVHHEGWIFVAVEAGHLDFAGDGRDAGVTRFLHGGATHRVGPLVEAEGQAVAAHVGFAQDGGGISLALAGGTDLVVFDTLACHARQMGRHGGGRNPFFNGDGLDAREIGVQVQRIDVVAKVSTIDAAGGRDQTLHTMQHLLIGGHALFDATDGLAQHGGELRVQFLVGGIAFVVPGGPGDAQSGSQDQQGEQDQAYPVHGLLWNSTMAAASSALKYFWKMRRTVPSASMALTSARHFSCSAGGRAFLDMISPCSTEGSSKLMTLVASRMRFSSTTGQSKGSMIMPWMRLSSRASQSGSRPPAWLTRLAALNWSTMRLALVLQRKLRITPSWKCSLRATSARRVMPASLRTSRQYLLLKYQAKAAYLSRSGLVMPERLKSSAPDSISCQIRARDIRLTLTLQPLRRTSSSEKSLSMPVSVAAEQSRPWSCRASVQVREQSGPVDPAVPAAKLVGEANSAMTSEVTPAQQRTARLRMK
eukprot:TRINITY_DN665_c0_g3_i1.p1 TRINITY_DN665_c0_g3~~TRINITY_DN665_c0_g3_i1.p1  ORF type:complete len:1952 (-),score=631.07 TRINITY_DN665_c0_g3_i1:246-6101(-)